MARTVNPKTDNSALAAKLHLRRHMLRLHHVEQDEEIHVFDACQGGGVIWGVLRREFPISSYWGVDLKGRTGRLKVDSVHVLAQEGWTQNVIDIDTYGSPWDHWRAMLPNVTRPVTVFLTIGSGGTSPMRTRLSKDDMATIGMTGRVNELLNRMRGFNGKFYKYVFPYALAQAYDLRLEIVDLVEAYVPPATEWRTRYVGVRLQPKEEEV